MKRLKIEVSSRVDLYICDAGFRFVLSGEKPRFYIEWGHWKFYWTPYNDNGIKEKVYKELDKLPDRFKTHKFYQAITF